MKVNRVLVTGGLGFIGTTVVERYLEQGAEVTIVDSCVSNVVEPEHFDAFGSRPRVIVQPVAQYLAMEPDLSGFELLVHAASFVGPASILAYQGTIASGIIRATSDVVHACLDASLPLIYFSSAEVYGKSGILEENGDIRVPPYYNARIEYALAKLTCEAMVLNNAVNGLRSVVIRPFNVAGPLQSRAGGFVMPTFVQQALGGRPITVFDSGMQTRAFLGSSDLAVFLADFVDGAILAEPQVFNVGNPDNAITMLDLAHRIRELVGSDSEIVMTSGAEVYGPLYREAESIEKVPNISRARARGWGPKQELDDIIRETIQYYKEHPDTRGADARLETGAESPEPASTIASD